MSPREGKKSGRPKHSRPSAAQMDERLAIPLDPEDLIKGVLGTDPTGSPVGSEPENDASDA
jgi:hypothetical protein